VNDGLCEYPDEGFDCAGWPLGACCDGSACFQQSQINCEAVDVFIWKGTGVSCFPNPCLNAGCTDDTACNYDETAEVDDGSCIDIADGSCDCDGNVLDECGVCGGDGPPEHYDCDGNCLNDTDDDGVCDEFEVAGCTYSLACNYDITATHDDGSCIFAEDCATCDGSGGVDANDSDQDGVCDEDEVPGCMDSGYLEFNPLATDPDGSCSTPIAEGCTCECASNYDASANVDDGSCDTTTTTSGCGTVECPDLDCDGIVSVSDILALLAGFGMDCNGN
ncbi:MAG: hypothetical protein P8M07_06870, partial [Flavobacteriales bacterium]|nr:hypothetical protein [Flavobacteriales bacterium]